MKEKYYKLKTTLYSDDDNTISNVAMYEYDTKKKREILTTPVWAKKGEIFRIIEISRDDYKYDFEELDDEYGITYQPNWQDIKYIIVNKKNTKWYFAEDFKNAYEHFEPMFCSYCFNATQCEDLDETNDFSSCGIGESDKNRKTWLMLDSSKVGGVCIEARQYWAEKDGGDNRNHCVARYCPKHCPECGRLLKENEKFRENK